MRIKMSEYTAPQNRMNKILSELYTDKITINEACETLHKTRDEVWELLDSFEYFPTQNTPTLYMWCDNCYTWVSEVSVDFLPCGESWICCEACCNGLIHFGGERV